MTIIAYQDIIVKSFDIKKPLFYKDFLIQLRNMATQYTKIILPVRPQSDTIVAIYLLQTYGKERFPGVESAKISIVDAIDENETAESMDAQGIILIDIGGGVFDHHGKPEQTTASALIAKHLGVIADPSISKMLKYAERCDFYGKGTISEDPLDRAFGLSGLITVAKKVYENDSQKVVDIFLPILAVHHSEEIRRTKEMPKEVEEKTALGKTDSFVVKQRGKNLKVFTIETDNPSLSGFLRSQMGGAYDVVALELSSGHINIMTRPTKRVDLRSLVALLRMQELEKAGPTVVLSPKELAGAGRLEVVPEWYYDTATNSILNGGMNPKNIPPTKVSRFEMRKILELGLSEQLWSPKN